MRVAHAPFNSGDYRSLETSPASSFGEVSKELLQTLALRIVAEKETGAPLAINDSTSGGSADLPHRPRRGGARNCAARQSCALSKGQITNLTEATHHASALGLPFNRMITIHWGAAGVPLERMAKSTGRFIDLLTKALARHGSPTAWVWVHENGSRKGGHCHLLVHVPPRLVPMVTERQRGWLRRVTGKPYRARVIHSKPIGGRLGLEVNNPDVHSVNLTVALAYLLKGAEPTAAQELSIERLEAGGKIIGKRCGTSQNIGLAARKRIKEQCR